MTTTTTLVSPKQAARAIGVSESSLKRWCDGGLLQMTRTAGGHRKIAIGEVIRFANQNGASLVAPEEFSLSITRENPASRIADSHLRLAEALLTGSESAARQILLDLFLANHSLSTLCDDVIAPAFREIGDRWSCGSANVYQERRGCEIILWILHELRRVIPPVEPGRLALGGAISGDLYEIPSAVAELVLRSLGYDAQNLGTSIPLSELARAIHDLQPQLFWLSVSHVCDETRFVEDFSELSSACSAVGASLVVGGRALNEDLRRRLTYSAYCDTMKHLENFAEDLSRRSPKRNPNARGRRARRRNLRHAIQPNALRRNRAN
jgi:methanogenic corrinoid protein MtbC1